jgi:uncharacterized membrane protein YcfT
MLKIGGPAVWVRNNKFVEIELIDLILIFFIALLICLCELFLSIQFKREAFSNLAQSKPKPLFSKE